MLAVLIAKHEYDARYQLPELKLYIAQLYMPIISMVRDRTKEVIACRSGDIAMHA